MTKLKVGDNVIDKTKQLNKGFPMQISKIENRMAVVEFFEGDEAIHKVFSISIDLLRIVE